MPWVKLMIRAEPQEVSGEELVILRGQNLIEKELEGPPAGGTPADPATTAAAQAAGTEEQ